MRSNSPVLKLNRRHPFTPSVASEPQRGTRSRGALLLFVSVLGLLSSSSALAEPLIGPGVGNFDLLVADGNRLYNEKKYEQARDNFLKATRVAPEKVPTYLSLARAWLATKQPEYACPAYKAFLKNAPEGSDRQKAQAELDGCDRQLKAKFPGGSNMTQAVVAMKASLYEALDKGNIVGEKSAAEVLKNLLDMQYAAPDLGEMASKVSGAALQRADATWRAATSHQKVTPEDLRKGSQLYKLGIDTGAPEGNNLARASFLEGLALLGEGKAFQAETLFADAVRRDPNDNEAKFYRGFAVYRTGDKAGAVAGLEKDLPNDPRTAILKVAMAFDRGPDAASTELEKFLFAKRFKNGP